MFDLSGRVVVVTGGNAGIGLGFAQGIARAGGDVVVWGRRPEKNDDAAKLLSEFGGRVLTQAVDISDEARVVTAMNEVVEEMGRVDGVIANAGIMKYAGSFVDITTDAWHDTLKINLDGTFYTVREGARHMKARYDEGDRSGGSLLLIASLAAKTGTSGQLNYNASKGALIPMCRGIAIESGRYLIRCNVVCPGHTESETVDFDDDHFMVKHVRQYNPMGRLGTPSDFEGIGVYFMSELSRHHTGDVVTIDGGWMANVGKTDIAQQPPWS